MIDETNVETAESAGASTEAQNSHSDEAQAETPNAQTNREKTFTQAELNRIVAKEAAKAVSKAIADKEAEAAQKAAEDQGQFKDLYESAKKELTTTTEELEALRALAHQQVDKTIADWPDEFKAFIPDAETSTPTVRMQAVERASAAVALVQRSKREIPDLNSQNGGKGSALDTPEAKRAASTLVRGF